MPKLFHQTFKFLDWNLDQSNYKLILNYEIESIGLVSEVLYFPRFDVLNYSVERIDAIKKACDLLHLLCGVSYYKSGLAENIYFDNKKPTKEMAKFLQKTWKNGLAEMAYENGISLKNRIRIPFDENLTRESNEIKSRQRALVPIGGGKDSMVTIEELKALDKSFDLFMVGDSQLIKNVANHTKIKLIQVSRKIDEKLIKYNKKGAFNGHVPITSINSAIAVLTSLLLNYDSIIFSNERSADSANTINLDGELVNHQYSKSLEFENDFRDILNKEISPNINYFSMQRPYSELAILEKFSKSPQHFHSFSSCNRNFHIAGSKNKNTLWCGDCPKCRFVFLGLTAFVDKECLIEIFGSNLLNEPSQEQGFAELLGLKGFKPFECVGEIEESQMAFNLIKDQNEWQDSYLVSIFKNKVKDHTQSEYQQVFEFSNSHNIPDDYLI